MFYMELKLNFLSVCTLNWMPRSTVNPGEDRLVVIFSLFLKYLISFEKNDKHYALSYVENNKS